jgi:hypothetical protein
MVTNDTGILVEQDAIFTGSYRDSVSAPAMRAEPNFPLFVYAALVNSTFVMKITYYTKSETQIAQIEVRVAITDDEGRYRLSGWELRRLLSPQFSCQGLIERNRSS